MQGKRVYLPLGTASQNLQPGDYAYCPQHGGWVAKTPNGHAANLTAHQVVEHADGTITVSPSIGVYYDSLEKFAYHGYLEKGIWRECQ